MSHRSLKLILLLLKSIYLKIDPAELSSEGFQVIQLARVNDHDDVVELLLNWKGKNAKRVDHTAGGNCAIRYASSKSNAKVVQHL